MNSKNELKDICPTSFEEAWIKYPKLRHLLQSTVLFDFQHEEWSPFETERLSNPINLFSNNNDSKVYIASKTENCLISHVVICKGEIKQIDHFDEYYNSQNDKQGELDLKIGAFVASSFKKMSCIICVHSIGNLIVKISLHPDFDYIDKNQDQEIIKSIKKLYNRRDWS